MYPNYHYPSAQAEIIDYSVAHAPVSGERRKPSGAAMAAGAAGLVAILALPAFVVTPWIVKQFRPDFSYGRRVGIGMGIAAGAALLRSALRKR
jgi:hypothetical protein